MRRDEGGEDEGRDPQTAGEWSLWAYKLGLKLDGIIPLLGRTNRERIEEAVARLRSRPSEEAEVHTECSHCGHKAVEVVALESLRTGEEEAGDD